MDLQRFCALALLAGVAGFSFPALVKAQDQETPESPAPAPPAGDTAPTATSPESAADDTLHPPVLVDFVEAKYPPEAAKTRTEGKVVLKLSVDAEGRVIDAEVQTPAGHGFDEAALEAARQFRFEPARRGSTPVAARILYVYDFQLPPAGTLAGKVLVPDTASEEVVAGATILVQGPDGAKYTTRTDADGTFRLEELPPGSYIVQAQAEGIGRIDTAVAVADDQTADTTLRLLPEEDQDPIEVTVWGSTDAERLRRSAQAVQVIELDDAQREASDLGEVLARQEGVSVRRAGGLGSATQFSLNGFSGDQIRFFLDGIPLEFAGYPFDVANVPVNLVERVDIYRGVVPIRFGADALGGGVNLVSEQDLTGSRGNVSYQVGSFDTNRVTALARHRHAPSGFFTRATGFFDTTRNDYRIDVEVPDDVGRLSDATVYRFHDSYRAAGGNLELGFVDTPWADRFLLRGFVTGFESELQHNIVMEVPYGGVESQELSAGGSLRYDNQFSDRLAVSLIGGYTRNRIEFLDVADCVFNWFGQCITDRTSPGEIQPGDPRDEVLWDNNAYGRLNLAWKPRPQHGINVSVSPTYVTRTGEDRLSPPEARDPLTAERDLITVVTGVEYELNLVNNRLQNLLFVKNYLQYARSEEPLPGGAFRELDRDTNRFGVGNAFRYRFVEWLWMKASYEFATRLPRPDEVFGDGALVVPNLELQPEISHNANLELTIDARDTRSGAWRTDLNAFLREAEQLIVLLGNDRVFSFQNVFGARSVGIEAAAGWTSRGEWISLDGNVTYQSVRNTSSEGTFGEFEGDRIPNQPYLFANGTTRFQVKEIGERNDVFTIVWYLRYVQGFFRTWESAGITQFKQTVDPQLLNTVAVTYILRARRAAFSFTGQVENIGDVQAFDFFGVQRPGRAYFFKLTADFFTPD